MAHIWVPDDEGWSVLVLARDTDCALDGYPPRLVPRGKGNQDAGPAVRLCPLDASEGPARGWCLVAAPAAEVLVNGLPLAAGMRVLRDRDEIRVGAAERYFFSTEEQARLEVYTPPEAEVEDHQQGSAGACPRCHTPIKPGDTVVRCAACGILHHQDEEQGLVCWTYTEQCALCNQSTDLEAGFAWSPEEL